MKRALIPMAVVAALAGAPLAADVAPTGPGWTGLTNPEDLIAARQGLMMEMERLMQPIDSYTIGEPAEPEDLRSAAETISHMLLVVPHLFPPSTNLYDPDAETPKTIALPDIWKNFDAFYAFAQAGAKSASDMAAMTKPDDLRAAASTLRQTCDACHMPFLRAYVAEKPSESDANFDFDSVFEK